MPERETLAFEACGCEVAYPTWWYRADGTTEQVDCVHLRCQIRRGEFKRPADLVRFTAAFRSEMGNWLRFARKTPAGRHAIAAMYWQQKRHRKFDILSAVYVGVSV